MSHPLGMLRYTEKHGQERGVEVTDVSEIREYVFNIDHSVGCEILKKNGTSCYAHEPAKAVMDRYDAMVSPPMHHLDWSGKTPIEMDDPSELTAGNESAGSRRARADQSATLGSF